MALLDNAQKDPLTLCYRREYLLPFMEHAMAEFSAYRKPFSILTILRELIPPESRG